MSDTLAGLGATADSGDLSGQSPMAQESATQATRSRFWSRLLRNKVAMTGAVYLVIVVIAAIFAPLLTSHDEILATRFQDILFSPGEAGYLLGEDLPALTRHALELWDHVTGGSAAADSQP